MSAIPIGASVYDGGSGMYYGHVGIYIGNGEIIHNTNDTGTYRVKSCSVDEWCARGDVCWGMPPTNETLLEGYTINKGLIENCGGKCGGAQN